MIKTFTVTNPQQEKLVLDLYNPESLQILTVDGLGPVKADIKRTALAVMDGSQVSMVRAPERNIVMSLALLDNPTVEDSRRLLYRYFPIKETITMAVETDQRTLEIEGVVESADPEIFLRNSTAMVSIICPNPWFYLVGDQGNQETTFSGIQSEFRFPWLNPTTESTIELSSIHRAQENNVPYYGDVPTGVTIVIGATGDVGNITIWNTRTNQSMTISSSMVQTLTGTKITTSDQIFITTIPGGKSVYLMRNGILINILNAVAPDSAWFTLRRGDNLFAFTATSGELNLTFSILNNVLFSGV